MDALMGKSSEKETGQASEVVGKGTFCSCWVDGSRKKEQWYSHRKPLKQAWDLNLPASPPPLPRMPGRERIPKDPGIQSVPEKKIREDSP